MRKLSTALKIAISLAILAFLFWRANLTEGFQYLTRLRFSYVLLSIMLIVTGQVLRAQRLGTMVFGGLGGANLWKVLRIQMVSFLPGIVSPAKVGEVAKIYMLQSELDIPMGRGLVCFVAERVLDLLLLGPLATVGLIVLFRHGLTVRMTAGGAQWVAVAAFAFTGFLVLGVIWIRRRGISLRDLWRTISPRGIAVAILITIFYWAVVFSEVWCFCKASVFDPQLWEISLVVPPALLSSMIPVSFSGFGVREAAMTILLQRPPVGAAYDRALLVSLMYDVVGLGIPALMGVFFWLIGKNNGTAQA